MLVDPPVGELQILFRFCAEMITLANDRATSRQPKEVADLGGGVI